MAHIPKAIESNINAHIESNVQYLKKLIEGMGSGTNYGKRFVLRDVDESACASIAARLRAAYPSFVIRHIYDASDYEHEPYSYWQCEISVDTKPMWWQRYV